MISTLLERVKRFNSDLTEGKIFQEVIKENESVIVDMNAENQLFEKGVNALGVSISSYRPYSDKTVEIKKMKGQPFNRVTLRDTGDFHSAFFVRVSRENFSIDSTDWKTKKLVKKYGDQNGDIFGLTDENLTELIMYYVAPEVLEIAKKMILQ